MWRLVLVVLALVSAARSQTYPSSVLIPSNSLSDVVMECAGLRPVRWRVNGTNVDFNDPPDEFITSVMSLLGGNRSRTITVRKEHVLSFNGSSFQCSVNRQNFSSVPTAFLMVFGNASSIIMVIELLLINSHFEYLL